MERAELAWNLFVELRKELVESQRLRAQVIGFKITFVTATLAVATANLDKIPSTIFVFPAVAAVFFDLLIASYGFSIKRAACYVRNHLEPILREEGSWPPERPLWEAFMTRGEARQALAFWGNMGITGLASVVGLVALFLSASPTPSEFWRSAIAILIAELLAADVWATFLPGRFATTTSDPKGRQAVHSTAQRIRGFLSRVMVRWGRSARGEPRGSS